MKSDWLSTGEAAKLCSVTPDAVLKWIRGGRVPARRTPGGHFRIHRADLARLQAERRDRAPMFCFEFNARDGQLAEGCRECAVYRAMALRCYEMMDLVADGRHARQFCETTCEECDYYRTVRHGLGVLVYSDRPGVRDELEAEDPGALKLAVVDTEYALAVAIGAVRPDFVVLDCRAGLERALGIAGELEADGRLDRVGIVLDTDDGEGREECRRRGYGRIGHPYGIGEILEGIEGLRRR